MAKLTKSTIHRLAVLRALSLWQRGAYGALRLHKILFAADKHSTSKLFTFKKYYLGQYSEDVSEALNALRSAGRLRASFDGPAERLIPIIAPVSAARIDKLFTAGFPKWMRALRGAVQEWGRLSHDNVLKKAHEDATRTENTHDHVIFASTLPDLVDVPGLSAEAAEELTDLVDEKLSSTLRERPTAAAKAPVHASNWRQAYFGESPRTRKAV
jgi:hypothetical protein